MANTNRSLQQANRAKKDEFYTQLSDIERECRHYADFFRDKTVLCNCDDPRISNFFHYFAYNFEHLGLKKLITTCYKNQNVDLFSQHDCEKAVYLVYEGDKNGNRVPDPEEIGIREFKGDGDFRSPECIELLKEADVVVTNPPFSLFREYVAQLMQDEDVTSKSGIYEYLLGGDERHLSIRAFPPSMRRAAYERQRGICVKCGQQCELTQMEADHITPWSQGGKTAADNCQMLCRDCNRRKSDV